MKQGIVGGMMGAIVALGISLLAQSWTTPRTWVTGEVVGAGQFNTHVRDNLTYLYNALTSPDKSGRERHDQRPLQHGASRDRHGVGVDLSPRGPDLGGAERRAPDSRHDPDGAARQSGGDRRAQDGNGLVHLQPWAGLHDARLLVFSVARVELYPSTPDAVVGGNPAHQHDRPIQSARELWNDQQSREPGVLAICHVIRPAVSLDHGGRRRRDRVVLGSGRSRQ